MREETKRALVTGTSRGLGKALALELARRGFHVFAGVRDPAQAGPLLEAAKTFTGTVELQRMDVAALGSYQIPDGLSVLINNAGYRGPYLPVEAAGMDEWRRTFDTNFFGLIDVTQRAIPVLRKSGDGIIRNIGSLGASTPLPFYSIYRSSKIALAALSEGLRIELAPFGIRVIEIPISGVDTDMLRSSIAHRQPDAIGYLQYQPMAEKQAAMPSEAKNNAIAPELAARNVIDQLFQGGPLLRVCDPNAIAGLAYNAASTAEERALAIMDRFNVKPA